MSRSEVSEILFIAERKLLRLGGLALVLLADRPFSLSLSLLTGYQIDLVRITAVSKELREGLLALLFCLRLLV